MHKDKSYLGEHEALVDEALWNEVQALLASYRLDRVPGTTDRQPSLLASILFDAQGERMTPTHAIKRGTRYRYYVSRSLLAGKTKDLGQRIPAPALETLVTERIRDWLADPAGVFARFRSPRSRTDSSLAVHRQLRYATKHRKSRSNSHCRNAKNTLNISVLSRGGGSSHQRTRLRAGSLLHGKIQGNSPFSVLRYPRRLVFRRKIQSLSNRIP